MGLEASERRADTVAEFENRRAAAKVWKVGYQISRRSFTSLDAMLTERMDVRSIVVTIQVESFGQGRRKTPRFTLTHPVRARRTVYYPHISDLTGPRRRQLYP